MPSLVVSVRSARFCADSWTSIDAVSHSSRTTYCRVGGAASPSNRLTSLLTCEKREFVEGQGGSPRCVACAHGGRAALLGGGYLSVVYNLSVELDRGSRDVEPICNAREDSARVVAALSEVVAFTFCGNELSLRLGQILQQRERWMMRPHMGG